MFVTNRLITALINWSIVQKGVDINVVNNASELILKIF
jgi:hypothetical protein